MGYDPVKFVSVSKSVLDEMDIVPDPNVDTLFLNKFATERIFFQISAFEISPKAGIA
jgi:hypothetical protein